LNKAALLRKIIEDNNGIAKTSDFVANGFEVYEVATFCKKGVIKRIRKGYYQLPQEEDMPQELLIQELLPQGIVCVESALFHYGYSDIAPDEWSLAVPRTATRVVSNIVEFPIKGFYIRPEFLEIGKTTDIFNGVILPIYDRERTICDCIKYRKRLDEELFDNAVRAYADDKHKNLENLNKYAQEMKLYPKVMSVMVDLLKN